MVISRVETVDDFSFISLTRGGAGSRSDFGLRESSKKDILDQLSKFKKANPDKKILSFQLDKTHIRGEVYVTGIYLHHEPKETK